MQPKWVFSIKTRTKKYSDSVGTKHILEMTSEISEEYLKNDKFIMEWLKK